MPRLAWLAALGVLASFVMLIRLGDRPIENADEGIYGEISLEMVESGNWLTLQHRGEVFYEKPPLKVWLSALLFWVFGPGAWGLRLPSALAGIATSLLLAWWVWEWRRSRGEAFLVGLVFATMRPIFYHTFLSGDLDGLLAAWITLALYGWWKASADVQAHRTAWAVVVGIALGLGIMTKSAAGLIPLPIMVAHGIASGSWRNLSWRMIAWACAAAMAVALPWHLAMFMVNGASFWANYVGRHVLERSTSSLHQGTDLWWYVPTFGTRFSPYAWWFLPALGFALFHSARRRREQRDSTLMLFLVWFAVVFIGFTLVPTRLEWYLLPLYPAAAALIIRFLVTAGEVFWSLPLALGHLAAFSAFLASLPAKFSDGPAVAQSIVRAFGPLLNPFVVAVLAATAIVILFIAIRRFFGLAWASRAALAVTVAVVMGWGLTITARELARKYPVQPLLSITNALRGTGGTLVTYGVRYRPAQYFILRSSLSGDVRVLDGLNDMNRTLGLLSGREGRLFLLTQDRDVLPPELARDFTDSRKYGGFTLWSRK